jgi:hypothetical protein
MPVIGWDETAPADGDPASSGDDAIRSVKTNISEGLGTSMYWPGTAGGSTASAGIMKPGAARTFYGTQSQVSAAQSGQMMYASDTSRLYYVGATGPAYLGGQFGVDHAKHPTAGSRWHLASGISNNGGLIAYGVTYGAPPTVVASLTTTADVGMLSVLTGVSTTGFYCGAYNESNTLLAASKCSVHWQSLGTVAI